MATVVVYDPNGAFIDGMHSVRGGFMNIVGGGTQVLPPGGVANTDGTVRVTATGTVQSDGRTTIAVTNNGV